jgi:hypothetical protein
MVPIASISHFRYMTLGNERRRFMHQTNENYLYATCIPADQSSILGRRGATALRLRNSSVRPVNDYQRLADDRRD